jgi:peptide/nickel transport system substrate-binding protein
MKKLRVPKSEKALKAIGTFSLTEKIIFYIFVGIFILSGLTLVYRLNEAFMEEVPARGGILTEGVIGTPRFINPLLATSEADKDLTQLVYSGLLKATPKGDLVPDLAESYTVSPDGLTYDFILKNNAYFHNGQKVTADDVLFTVQKAQDPALKSPKRANWDGISVEKVSDKEIKFTLKQPYYPFLENLTLGILPKQLWKDLDSDQFSSSLLNVEPVGSGPYKIKSVQKNSSGLPTNYNLISFSRYISGRPYISNLTIKFYSNENDVLSAFKNGAVESIDGISPQAISKLNLNGSKIDTSVLPRVFGVFFNQNQAPVFANKEVKVALDAALDKQKIIDDVLSGYGTAIKSPIPPGGEIQTTMPATINSSQDRVQQAQNILIKAGWTLNPQTKIMEKKGKKDMQTLSFSISTGDAPELKAAAQKIADQWKQIGADVSVKIFEIGDLNQNIIRPRKYDALFFGEIIGRDLDLYPFWHSSQRNDPGLNIAMYTNTKTDKLLETARVTLDKDKRLDIYKQFEQAVIADMPVAFTYSPEFIYIVPGKIKNLNLGEVTTPAERFLGIDKWYIETDKVWKIFAK